MSGDDLPEWYKKRKRRTPFFGNWFFGDIEDMMREMEEMMEQNFEQFRTRIPEEMKRERKLPDGSTVPEWGPFVYGYSMTIGPDGKPKIREFGNVKPSNEAETCGVNKPCLDVKQEREPLVDIVDLESEIKVIAELPGVAKEEIKLSGTPETLTISVDTEQRKYYKQIEIPSKIDPKKAKTSYKNGVLQVTLPKIEEEQANGEPIKVE
ncbi:MAG: Hsp20/alpha crystallin family protein [Candidatus Bathyarchaeota archaeon]|nr:Hsp20/alpha crystallin family protein [Candidatus Bathyarchaeum tardum]WGM89694.1 MAG: Hsp20/alpha crystallin family protein [Candidatus Bathyarchaeum tardum]WNZ30208.1 MAG: Hsp20/alpha crystallin family protein [Candidatus Bathyarchaeota archaeon]